MNMLKHPNDRHDGHVVLSDGNGELFVTEFNRLSENHALTDALRYCRSFLILSRRLEDIQ